jgi:hypothetical protein
MGYTRARRYANYKGGKKYDKLKDYIVLGRGTGAAEKAEAAAIFYTYWKKAEVNEQYDQMKRHWKQLRG